MQVQEIRRRLLARASALNIAAGSEEAALDALLDREIDVPAPTADECRTYYDAHPELFTAGALIEADHILFAVGERVPLEALLERAEEVLSSALAAPETFGELARNYSNCPSGALNGNLGQLSRSDVVPEFWKAIESLDGIGIVPRLVETRFGLHVVRLVRRIEGKPLPFETVHERIAQFLTARRLRVALREYAHGLLHEAEETQEAHADHGGATLSLIG
ncbi:MAG TPA: peptidylprolyl isomerase [Burkholderiaceae bacterium]|nr:peptidylprolyl isomerase [Burkholderiaceae bacterium]